MIPASFEELKGFSVPARFWPDYGYYGSARYVAIYWEPAGDEACYDDGMSALVGASWWVYLNLLKQFPYEHKIHTVTGSSEERATHWIVVDRRSGKAWLAKPIEAVRFMRQERGGNANHLLSSIFLRDKKEH